MPHLYLSQWEWRTDIEGSVSRSYWQPPGGNAIGALDLRDLPACGAAGGIPDGYGLFAYSFPQTGLTLSLGSDLERQTTRAERNGLETFLSLPLDSIAESQLLRVVRELLLTHADSTGQSRWRPLRGSLLSGVKFHLGGWGLVLNEKFSRSHPAWQTTIDMFRAGYRERRQREGLTDVLKRWTGDRMLRMGILDATELLPPEYAGDGSLEPRTTITDNFNRADSASLGSSSEGWSWTETQGNIDIVTNKAQAKTIGLLSARAESDLSSENHYAQAVATHSGSSSNKCGAAVRFASAANTYFKYQAKPAAAVNQHEITKVVTGTETSLFTATGNAFASGDTVKCDIDSADLINGYVNGVSRISGTDSSIQDNTRAGIAGEENVADRIQWDNFEAADLAAAVGHPTMRRWGSVKHMPTTGPRLAGVR